MSIQILTKMFLNFKLKVKVEARVEIAVPKITRHLDFAAAIQMSLCHVWNLFPKQTKMLICKQKTCQQFQSKLKLNVGLQEILSIFWSEVKTSHKPRTQEFNLVLSKFLPETRLGAPRIGLVKTPFKKRAVVLNSLPG